MRTTASGDAVLFDRLTRLRDSWSLRDRAAGDARIGGAWRALSRHGVPRRTLPALRALPAHLDRAVET